MVEQFAREDGLPATFPGRALGKAGDWLGCQIEGGRHVLVRYSRLTPNRLLELCGGSLDVLMACWPNVNADGETVGCHYARACTELMQAASRAGHLSLRDLAPDAERWPDDAAEQV